jgi:hypothetical protein
MQTRSVLLIACGALARELKALRSLGGWDHVEIQCLPTELHNTPLQIPAALRARLEAAKGHYDEVFVAYADCGTGGRLDAVLAEHDVERLPGAHCYEFLAGAERFAAQHEAEPRTFYLTDFLVRHFDRLVVRGLGLDRHPELLSDYFGNYRRVLYLAQTQSSELAARARSCAERLGLAFETQFTGLEPLERALAISPGRPNPNDATWPDESPCTGAMSRPR